MSDLIERQAAIRKLKRMATQAYIDNLNGSAETVIKCCIDVIERQIPSAQPERLTDDDFETIRIHLNAYKEKLCNQQRWEEAQEYQHIIDRFMAFASAQPKEVIPHRNYKYLSDYWCECGWHLGKKGEVKYCSECGRKVNWDG